MLINVAEALHDKKNRAHIRRDSEPLQRGRSTCGAHRRAIVIRKDNIHKTPCHTVDDQPP